MNISRKCFYSYYFNFHLQTLFFKTNLYLYWYLVKYHSLTFLVIYIWLPLVLQKYLKYLILNLCLVSLMSGLPQRQFLLNIFLRYTFFIYLMMFCWKWNILSSIMWHNSKSDSSPPPMFVFVVGCCCYLLSNFPELILWCLYFLLLVVIKVFTQFSHWSTNYWDRDFFKCSEPGSLLAFAEEFDVHFGICLQCAGGLQLCLSFHFLLV